MYYLLNIFDRFSGLIAPKICCVCGEKTNTRFIVCDSCISNHFIRVASSFGQNTYLGTRCKKCGRPLISAQNTCYSCRTIDSLTSIDRIFPLFPYTAIGQKLLVSWKLRGMRQFSSLFANLVAECRQSVALLRDLPIVPVPPRPGKRAEKGWDQIEELSDILKKKFNVPVQSCLMRTGGIQQKKLGRIARFSNIHGSIVWNKKTPVPLPAIILDDLMTTGSTLDACASALRYAGCETVYGITLFYD